MNLEGWVDMRIEWVPKQVGAKIYGNGCVTLTATIRRRYGVRDGDYVVIWIETYDASTRQRLGEGVVRARVTSGGEVYLSREVEGAQPGRLVDLVLIRSQA
jgi:hypothetical protein